VLNVARAPYDKIAFLYNFIVKNILKDYVSSLRLIDKHLVIEKNQKVLDIGGGTGLYATHLIDKVKTVTVVDLSFKMLKKINNLKILVLQADGSKLPIKDCIFDVAILIDVLHHINKNIQRQIISEVYRVLKKGGRIFVIEPFYKNDFKTRFFIKLEDLFSGKTYHINPGTIEVWLKELDFKNLKITYPIKQSCKFTIIAQK
jgi:ubiquinone/menaquinone biosynthesis C-methylase UbiE